MEMPAEGKELLRLDLQVIVLAGLTAAACAGPETRVREAAAAIRQTDHKMGDVRAEISSASGRLRDRDMSEQLIRSYSDETLTLLHDAARTTAFYFPDRARFVAAQQSSLDEKIRRGKATEYDIADMYKAYLGARMFSSAESLRKRFPNERLPSAPEVVVTAVVPNGQWRAYDLSEGWKKAKLMSLPLDDGPRVVMVMHTGCSVAERAMGQLLKDPETASEFRRLGLLVTLRFDAEGIWKWRDHFHFHEIYIADKADQYPGFDFNASPQFYFMNGGRIVRHFEGWDSTGASENGKAGWLAGLRAITSAVQ